MNNSELDVINNKMKYGDDLIRARFSYIIYGTEAEIEAAKNGVMPGHGDKSRFSGMIDSNWLTVGFSENNATSGFVATTFVNESTGKVIIAFRGSDNLPDWIGPNMALAADGQFASELGAPLFTDKSKESVARIQQSLSSSWDPQFEQALEYTREVIEKYQSLGYEIEVTGHSLGGALAQVAAHAYGLPGRTFDAPGAKNIIESNGYREWASQHPTASPPVPGFGPPADYFVNYTVNSSPVSSMTGPHIGPTVPISSFTGRQGANAYVDYGIAKTAGIANEVLGVVKVPAPRPDRAMLAATGFVAEHGVDVSNQHNMERIVRVFEKAARTGRLPQFGYNDDPTAPEHERALAQSPTSAPSDDPALRAAVEQSMRDPRMTDRELASQELADRGVAMAGVADPIHEDTQEQPALAAMDRHEQGRQDRTEPWIAELDAPLTRTDSPDRRVAAQPERAPVAHADARHEAQTGVEPRALSSAASQVENRRAHVAAVARGRSADEDAMEQRPELRREADHHRDPGENAPGMNHAAAVASASSPKDPRHPDHPDHALHQQIVAKTEALCESKGIHLASDELERVAASMTTEAKRQNISSADHVMFSQPRGTTDIGKNVIIIQGALDDPANRISVVAARAAVQTPIAESFDKLEQVNQAQAMQQQQQLAQEQQQEQTRSAHRMVM